MTGSTYSISIIYVCTLCLIGMYAFKNRDSRGVCVAHEGEHFVTHIGTMIRHDVSN